MAGQLDAVSCSSATFCVAVGEDDQGDGLIFAWNGSTWTRQSPGGLGSDAEVALSAVSCIAPDGCTAVGSVQTSTGAYVQATAQRWDGTSWTNANAVTSTTGSKLTGVSCLGRKICFAVGISDVNNPRPLIEMSNAAGWQVQTVPSRNEVQRLTGISCTTTSSCVAAGYALGGTSATGLSEVWDGTQWTARNLPYDSAGSTVAGISCPSSTACVAVGHSGNFESEFQSGQAPRLPLGLRWNGTSWTGLPTAGPAGDIASNAGQVSCPDPQMCMLVEDYISRTGVMTPAASIRTGGPGSSWQALSLTDSEPSLRNIGDLSCASSTMCMALGDLVGSYRPVALLWNGVDLVAHRCAAGRHRLPQLGVVPERDVLHGDRRSAGRVRSAGAGRGLERLDVDAVQRRRVEAAIPSSTACPARRRPPVSGSARSTPAGAPERPFVEVWNGSTWAVSPSAAPGTNSYLQGVSCVSSRHCVGVGAYTARGKSLAFAETYNGSRWTFTAVPQGLMGQGALTSVDCTSTTTCVAVGEESTFDQSQTDSTLIETLDGSTWTATSGVGTTGSDENGWLASVSCPSFCETDGVVEHRRDLPNYVFHVITLSSGTE